MLRLAQHESPPLATSARPKGTFRVSLLRLVNRLAGEPCPRGPVSYKGFNRGWSATGRLITGPARAPADATSWDGKPGKFALLER